MRYLITTNDSPPFLTYLFDSENHFSKENGMIVYDLQLNQFTIDGVNWLPIEIDHL